MTGTFSIDSIRPSTPSPHPPPPHPHGLAVDSYITIATDVCRNRAKPNLRTLLVAERFKDRAD